MIFLHLSIIKKSNMMNNTTKLIVQFKNVLEETKKLASKTNKPAVLIIQQRPNDSDNIPVIPMIRESVSNIIAFFCVTDDILVEEAIILSKGIINAIVLDHTLKRKNSSLIIDKVYHVASKCGLKVLTYNDYDSWTNSAIRFIEYNEEYRLSNKKILLIGKNYLSTRMLLQLIDCGALVYLYRSEFENFDFPYLNDSVISICSKNIKWFEDECENEFDILLGCCIFSVYDNIEHLHRNHYKSIYDIGINNFNQEFITWIKKNGTMRIFRSDDRAGIASVVLNLMETDYLVQHCTGRKTICGINLVAGGFIGEYGDVVVDCIENPHKILGIADGNGTFKELLTEEDLNNIENIKLLLI